MRLKLFRSRNTTAISLRSRYAGNACCRGRASAGGYMPVSASWWPVPRRSSIIQAADIPRDGPVFGSASWHPCGSYLPGGDLRCGCVKIVSFSPTRRASLAWGKAWWRMKPATAGEW